MLYARNLNNFVALLVTKGEGGPKLEIDTKDELIAGALLTRDGQIVHPNLKS